MWISLPGLMYAVFSGMWRKQLRERFGIKGDLVDDFCSAFFCGCCVRAQESRAVAVLSEDELDFCCDEPLRAATDKHQELRDKCELEDADKVEGAAPSSQGGFKEHWDALSSFSQGLLIVEGVVFFLACVLSGGFTNTLILLLSTIQPSVILYFLWWRSHRLDAQADLVVKYFSIGFFWTPLAAMYFELLLANVGMIFLLPFLGPIRVEDTDEDDADNVDDTDDGDDEPHKIKLTGAQLFVIALYTSFVVAALVEEVLKYTIVRFCPVPSDAATAGAPNYVARNDRNELGIRHASSNPAAHRATLIYFVAGALGFTMLETLGYVFGVGHHTNAMHQFWCASLGFWQLPQGASRPSEPFLTSHVLRRYLGPVHVICAALQAANVIENQVLGKEMRLYHILAVPVLVHGAFDFVLFCTAPVRIVAAGNGAPYHRLR
eukprot:scaffold7483_cov286-Pinguiococcus_pyrenoidosus.AAC.6